VKITLYHNPHCSKSRAVLALLQGKGLDIEIIEYLKTPADPQTLTGLLAKLGGQAHQLVRSNEPEYQRLKLMQVDEVQLIKAIAEHPILMQRPIVVAGNHAVIGRPPENVLAIL
jgi:arsenate reductase